MTAAIPEERFAFGANWRDFLQHLSDDRIQSAEQSLTTMLGRDRLDGLRFLDVGSGSGLFSLAARRLGAQVVSFDYDIDSVNCTRELRRRYFPGDPQWDRIEQGSVLDDQYLASLGSFDIVYSWGVLHHTGQMWKALDNTAALVRPGGTLLIALYNDQGWISKYWRSVKRQYHQGGWRRWLLNAAFLPYLVGARFVVLKIRRRELQRGMSLLHDARDWLGGLPFEVASRERVRDHLANRGFRLTHLHSCGRRHGCNEFALVRES